MKEQKEYLCSACEWTDRAKKGEILTECPICGGILTELNIEVSEPVSAEKPQKYNKDDIEKVANEDLEENVKNI